MKNKYWLSVLIVYSFSLVDFASGQGYSNQPLNETHMQTEARLISEAKKNIEKFRKGDASIILQDKEGKPLKNLSVTINQVTQDFLFGNLSEEVFRPELTPDEAAKFTSKFTALFNFTELTVKWTYYEREQGKPMWQKLQEKLDWCKRNQVIPKGHTLGWTNMSGTPPWLLKLPIDQANELYKARIQNLVGGFKDQIKMWDVVNEPITTVPWEVALKDSVFGPSKIDEGSRYKTTGITLEQTMPWVERSYNWAYEANEAGEFIINEFNIISKPETRRKYFELIKALLDKKTRVQGVGIQAHEPRDMWFSPLEVLKTFDTFQTLGLPVHITEFIPQSSGKTITGGWRQGIWTEKAQAEFASQFYTLAFSHPAVKSIHWWGLSDRFIWLKGGGLLNADLDPKPVYTSLLRLIKSEWMTKDLTIKTSKNGQLDFRGFYGAYELVVSLPDGSQKKLKLHLGEQGQKKWMFTL